MKVKVSLIGIFDMLKFKNLKKNRLEAINNTPINRLQEQKVNVLASYYHPKKQYLVIKDIVKENETTKTFVLGPDEEKGTKKLAYFKAGSYLSIFVKVGDETVSRAYAISSSPKEALNGIYKITVKRKVGGFLSTYLLDHAKVGDKFFSSDPGGFLTYSRIRDAKNVIAIAGGTGITPFVSMAKAIRDGIEDFNLTILYGVNTLDDGIFAKELKEISSVTPKVKVVYVVAKEEVEGCEIGFVSSEIIKKYAPEKDKYSLFISGPNPMFDYLATQLPNLGIEQKYIRMEKSPATLDLGNRVFDLTVHMEDQILHLKASESETVLTALERNDVLIRSKCHLGGCGFCRSKILKGTIATTKLNKQSELDKTLGYFHPCCSYPTSDLEIEVYKY